ncbi:MULTISPECIES: thiolase C-terminal domain-containing protein [unclassified Bradyrhizobium]|uniref:thiolase C-terminal domain-containing protein n=1 Tax=unclassified Bradyrhizobium TaxID=2631580 RepID=UPI001BAD29B1|nr:MULTISPECIES: thiolase [unclassified Bradyrhizobium]MBR1203011.1 thiolase [Bradyrhizobium sp. AUGA SZCCT0124]MBR1314426.1 thiolase [Bradyrhizobium sp. AUGA SZCCT0051]MBR1342556.1 thiolase [Bradyrhizobium sp. AUGA SZCCT0105]MBR1352786.1 thiolase [Bradyrhizobium sp. AUGA SZCCT0045]
MSDTSLRGKVAVIGIGMSAVGKVSGRSPLSLAAEAARNALADAGISKSEVDGVLSSHAFASPFHRFSVAFSEYFGIRPTFSNTLQVSGATAATMLSIGAAAIHGGLAKVVLVVAADSLLTGLTPDLALRSLTESRDQQYEMPFGIPVANTFAMTAHRHMKEFGTTVEQLAEVAVAHRRHASQTPGAQQTTPITVEDVLTSPMVTTPYHKLDCSLISDGGAAFVLVSAEYAEALGIEKPVYILGCGECYTHEHIFLMPSLTSTGAVESGRLAYAMAGYGPADMDVAGIYDCFTGTVIMMLEDLGFCRKGEGGPFVADGQMTYGGRIPANTHGGLLSFAHSGIPGSLFHFHEVIAQLRGQCGDRQVARAQLGLVHSLGAGFATNASTVLGTREAL